ncbi:unnamed protein product [Closterium sp. NIES-54]
MPHDGPALNTLGPAPANNDLIPPSLHWQHKHTRHGHISYSAQQPYSNQVLRRYSSPHPNPSPSPAPPPTPPTPRPPSPPPTTHNPLHTKPHSQPHLPPQMLQHLSSVQLPTRHLNLPPRLGHIQCTPTPHTTQPFHNPRDPTTPLYSPPEMLQRLSHVQLSTPAEGAEAPVAATAGKATDGKTAEGKRARWREQKAAGEGAEAAVAATAGWKAGCREQNLAGRQQAEAVAAVVAAVAVAEEAVTAAAAVAAAAAEEPVAAADVTVAAREG